jgi:hypothetical protein
MSTYSDSDRISSRHHPSRLHTYTADFAMSELDKPGEPSSLRPASGLRTGSIPLYLINGVATVWDAQGESIDSTHLSQSKPIRATLSMELNGLPYRELGLELGQMVCTGTKLTSEQSPRRCTASTTSRDYERGRCLGYLSRTGSSVCL